MVPKLVDEAAKTHERFALQETIAVLSDSELLRNHLEGVDALGRGEHLDEDKLVVAMRAAGRSSTSG